MQRTEDGGDADQRRPEWDVMNDFSLRSFNPNLPFDSTQSNDPYEIARYLNELVKELRTLDTLKFTRPNKLNHTYALLANEIDRIWTVIYMRALRGEQVNNSQQIVPEGSYITIQEKVMIPQRPNSKFIGRILGPRGISVKQLEAQTHCRILIRGKGSIKDARREARLRNRPGWEHLAEPLHVLITATDFSHERCVQKLAVGVHCIKVLLSTNDDEHKRRQLVQLAIINGTYRPTHADYRG
ncbi:KH domain family protein [Acanthocheilonema viteae]|uniref:K Homology domain-containing protein n=1 Tax=Acanthocheilonema viteae TaxID=6277 RepID=A0A498SBR0_ACAVI|nr:unnamed protein product [Acanthocheilonema viteae]